MQDAPHYDDVVLEVTGYLEERVAAAEAAGIPRVMSTAGFEYFVSLMPPPVVTNWWIGNLHGHLLFPRSSARATRCR